MSTHPLWKSRSRIDALKRHFARAFLILGGASMLLPLAWMVVTSLKDNHTLRNRPSDWVISLPSGRRAGTLRLDALFFVTDDFDERDLAGFESPDESQLTSRHLDVSLTADAFAAETGEAKRMELARAGRGALEMRYDFTGGAPASVRIEFAKPRTFKALVGLNLWIFGDASGHEVSLKLETDRGTLATSTPWELNFEHWSELSCYFREIDRLGGMPLLVPEGAAHEGGDEWFDSAEPLDLNVRAMELTVSEVPYVSALWNHLTYNYRRVWDTVPLGLYYWNTLLVAFTVALGQIITSSLAAYAFARLRFPGRDYLFYGYLATMMIPNDVTMIPRFILVQMLHLPDFWAIVIPGLSTTFGTFLLRQFFLSLPRDLEEAAMIDGCGLFGIYWRVIVPLSKPALATLAVISFTGAWNMFLWPLIVTKSQDNWVLQVGLAKMQSNMGNNFNIMMAGALVALVPAVIVFTAAQRAFREGIVLSGMKG